MRARARVNEIREGVLFLPFHYGYWDTDAGHRPEGAGRAANELTITDWDPASKQPLFKTSAAGVRVVEQAAGQSAPAPTTTASAPVRGDIQPTRGGPEAEASEQFVPTGGER